MDCPIKIGADGIDVDALCKELAERAEARVKNGEYDSSIAFEAERFNLDAVGDSAEFFKRYLAGIHSVTQVNINDWEIVEKRASKLAPLLVKLKKTIRSLLRFYTYHLWSQQNIANDIFYTTMKMVNERSDKQIADLTKKIVDLEKRLAAYEGRETK